MDTKAIGARISLFRSRANMTQTELAQKLGCTPQHISAIERGIKTPKLDTFAAIANILHVQPNLLLQDVLDDWKEGWEADVDRVLTALPPIARQRLKTEILTARQLAEELDNDKTRAW